MSGEARLKLAHLYPNLMNIYGDRGNIICLRQRCLWREIELEVTGIGLDEEFDPLAYDLLFMGGGQDREQQMVAEDLQVKGQAIKAAIESGVVALAVCGGYQLFGRYYRPAEGPELVGIEVFDAWTIHKGSDVPRCIGNVVARWNNHTLVGFENHGGRTYLGPQAKPLAQVIHGHGNNSEDDGEGAVYKNAYGTYLHGSLLPKNPHFADHLLSLALAQKYGDFPLAPLDDSLETRAHEAALKMVGKRRWLSRLGT